ncbi:MAG: hypothetical protein FWD67_11260 [Betaproteobacteria bacterium]|nr:hypothetical protein [Betaproteobacteria bacterium]
MNDANQHIRKLELHYVFQSANSSHALDAFARNKCEDAFLKIVTEIANSFGEYVSISVEPHVEGGLRDVYKFIISPKGQRLATWGTLIVAVVTLVMQFPSGSDRELSRLSVVKTKYEIEKLQLEIAQLKKNNSIQNTVESIHDNVKIRRQKSNFYNRALACQEIQKIEFSEIESQSNRLIQNSLISIDRKDFHKFVEGDIYVPSEKIENVIIEIIAPVLVRSKIQWKGIIKANNNTEKRIIDFRMLDSVFQNDVHNQNITFRHGTHIECTLELHKKVDLDGNVVVSKYDVIAVTRFYDDVGTDINMILRKRKDTSTQFPLFSELD